MVSDRVEIHYYIQMCNGKRIVSGIKHVVYISNGRMDFSPKWDFSQYTNLKHMWQSRKEIIDLCNVTNLEKKAMVQLAC